MAATIITGAVTIVCTIITVWAGMRKGQQDIKVSQAVTDEKLAELTREVRRHNNFAERLPVLEEKIRVLEEGR